jgi:FkbM family methyltransferase
MPRILNETKMLIQKLSGHLLRLRNARRFGVRFLRRGSFRMPERVKLPGGLVELSSPKENGARTDFLTCLLNDGYGLAGIHDHPVTILDIGANIGFFALAARSFFPSATIHCYEPNPRILPYLEKNAASAGARVFREAVGAGAGTVFLEERGDSNQARTAGATTGLAVPQVGLASAVERLNGKIDLAKIDCEGAEWEMFENPAPWKSIRHLRMEYHLIGKRRFADVECRLSSLGFEILQHHPSGGWGTVWALRQKT